MKAHEETMINKIPANKGQRIEKIRKMLIGHTRKEFAENTGISENTIKLWETPPAGRSGITQKGAKKFVDVIKKLGVTCTVDWIMTGKGHPPSSLAIQEHLTYKPTAITWDEEESILRDIEAFKSNNRNPIVVLVTDGSVLPIYFYGDYVGGSKRFDDDIDRLVGSICIVELENETIIRRISEKHPKRKYLLTAVNEDKSVSNPTITNAAIVSAAKIIWHRSRENFINTI
ncbi:MAG TPA: helix-turn-helix transcriptional regulator [Gammaproteobacteria bacterium]|nr:helix-turn-helix transcriptional regulator [Gammaproteobacteria bacterium]